MPLTGRRRAGVLVAWIALLVILTIAGLELAVALLLVDWTGVGKRPFHPYLMNGDFYEDKPDAAMLAREGPGVYGYVRRGGMYLYTFEQRVHSIADRAEFLFQDRAALANGTAPDDVLRVFVVGGSAAYGVGASSRDNRWYALLERSLTAALGRAVRLIPAAMSGYVSTQELLVLELIVLPRCPDAVIVFNGFNDAALPAIFGSRPGDPYNQGILYEQFYSSGFGIRKTLARYSHLYRYWMKWRFRGALEANRQAVLRDPDRLASYAASTASVYLDNVLRMLALCRDASVPCHVFVQPARALTRQKQGIQKPLNSGDILTVAAYDEILKRLSRLDTDSIHDLTSVFDGSAARGRQYDMVHFTDEGHRAIADTMQPWVLDTLRQGAARGRSSCAARQVGGRS